MELRIKRRRKYPYELRNIKVRGQPVEKTTIPFNGTKRPTFLRTPTLYTIHTHTAPYVIGNEMQSSASLEEKFENFYNFGHKKYFLAGHRTAHFHVVFSFTYFDSGREKKTTFDGTQRLHTRTTTATRSMKCQIRPIDRYYEGKWLGSLQ